MNDIAQKNRGRLGHPCAETRCAAIVPDGQRYCPAHKKRVEKTEQPFGRKKVDPLALYRTEAWKRARKAVLTEQPICAHCRRAAATVVHHIKQARDNPELWFNRDNLEALCGSCHNRESQRESMEARTKSNI